MSESREAREQSVQLLGRLHDRRPLSRRYWHADTWSRWTSLEDLANGRERFASFCGAAPPMPTSDVLTFETIHHRCIITEGNRMSRTGTTQSPDWNFGENWDRFRRRCAINAIQYR